MRRFADVYLWSQALKVFGFVWWAFAIVIVEHAARLLLTVVGFCVPAFVLEWIARQWRGSVLPSLPGLLKRSASFQSAAKLRDEQDEAQAELYYDSTELIQKRGYSFEQHYVETADGFLLGLHRIPFGRSDSPGALAAAAAAAAAGAPAPPPRPVVFLHHGFLQSSEAWVAARSNLAFQLADGGFDVWLANARGNKYSAHHRTLTPDQDAYWNFCIDDVAARDLPAALRYVVTAAGVPTLSYVGFSQGTAVAFASFSARSDIAALVNVFIALAPATTAKGFSQPLLDSIAKLSPDFVFFLLGKQALFGNAFYFWQNLLSNAQLVRVIDWFVAGMFHWHTNRISAADKPVLYAHIYSMSSVKSVVHWFQIMKAGRFQMYEEWNSSSKPPGVFTRPPPPAATVAPATAVADPPVAAEVGEGEERDDVLASAVSPSVEAAAAEAVAFPSSFSPPPSSPSSRPAVNRVYSSRVAQVYPLQQIRCPIHVMWGSADHLPDTAWLLANLPPQATSQEFEGFEHLDFLYAEEAKRTVWPDVVARCKQAADTAATTAAAALVEARKHKDKCRCSH